MAGLEGKVVLISGASSGIGQATAIEFAKYNVRLALTARNEANLIRTVEKCKEKGLASDNIFYVLGDLCKEGDVQNIIDSTIKQYGKIDVLCNIGGLMRTMSFWNCSTQDFRDHIEWLIMPFWHMCKIAMPLLYDTKGVILNIGSLASLRPYNTLFPYSVCKAASDQMTKCLALEGASKGVRVCAIDPGTIWNTGLWESSGICPTKDRLLSHRAKSEPMYPVLRVGCAREVAQVFVFLASDDAKFITGVQFPVDGGISVMSQHMMETNEKLTLTESTTPDE